ncbi:MAG TPA: hypothetical protein DD713_03700 [Nitrospiraceae bacterium]|nr:hypothetical protein [Nitrospiraceae bacterium]
MFEKLIVKVASSLKKHEIPYMIIGGQAVLLYGTPRLTRDIDITLGISTDKLSLAGKAILAKNPACDRSYVKKWLAEFDKISEGKKFRETFKNIQRQIK